MMKALMAETASRIPRRAEGESISKARVENDQSSAKTEARCPIVPNPEGMHEVDRREGEDDERRHDDRGDARIQPRREEIERDDVPQRREAAEVIVVGLHVAAGEDVEGRQLDEGGQRQGRGVRQQSGFENEQGRDENVVEIVDDEVEHVAVDARRRVPSPGPRGPLCRRRRPRPARRTATASPPSSDARRWRGRRARRARRPMRRRHELPTPRRCRMSPFFSHADCANERAYGRSYIAVSAAKPLTPCRVTQGMSSPAQTPISQNPGTTAGGSSVPTARA